MQEFMFKVRVVPDKAPESNCSELMVYTCRAADLKQAGRLVQHRLSCSGKLAIEIVDYIEIPEFTDDVEKIKWWRKHA